MKVACIGNMNNNFFSVTRYLRDRGIDCHLLLFDNEFSHFHPSADAYTLEYQEFTRYLEWGNPFRFLSYSPQMIRESIEGYDFLIGCGGAPAFLARANRRLDLFIPYGTDIYQYPWFKRVNPKFQIAFCMFSIYQKKGITKTPFLDMDKTNDYMEKIINRLKYPGERIFCGIPMLYTPDYNPTSIASFYDRSYWHKEFECIRREHEFVVFYHARHMWDMDKTRIDYKGTDKLINGFAQFAHAHASKKVCLVLFEYGKDVAVSRKLIQQLGISKQVRWFPQCTRKDIMIGLSLADLGTAEFEKSWICGGVIYEILAMAKPLMQYREDSYYSRLYPELFPIVNCKTADEIAIGMSNVMKDPEKYRKMGERGRKWFQKYVIDSSIEKYLSLLKK